MSKDLSEVEDSFVVMENLKPIKLVRFREREPCPCWNSIYNIADPDCVLCNGTGSVIPMRNESLIYGCIQSSGSIVDDHDPIIYVCTFVKNVSIGDGMVIQGRSYMVINTEWEYTFDGREVLVCGLDYERNHNHNKADLERYK